jgi:hypothetical protein
MPVIPWDPLTPTGPVFLSIPHIPEPARLIVSVLTPCPRLLDEVVLPLTTELGPIEEVVGPLAFQYTSYYDPEMGSGIQRWLWSFERLTDRSELARIKLLTNRVEQDYTDNGKRRVNLDPGLMTLGNFVLATGKNNAHRIYLSEGIFADLTLIFRSGSYRPLEWTYPDYADPPLIGILNRLRETYKCALQPGNRPTAS